MSSAPLILCYDGSEDAAVAITHAAELFGSRPAVVLVVWPRANAQVAYTWPGLVYTQDFEALDAAAGKAAEELAEKGADLAREAGLDATPATMRASGAIWQAILDVAEDRDAAAIVLGSRGLGGIRSLVLGSVSGAVVHHTSRPTLIVRHGVAADAARAA